MAVTDALPLSGIVEPSIKKEVDSIRSPISQSANAVYLTSLPDGQEVNQELRSCPCANFKPEGRDGTSCQSTATNSVCQSNECGDFRKTGQQQKYFGPEVEHYGRGSVEGAKTESAGVRDHNGRNGSRLRESGSIGKNTGTKQPGDNVWIPKGPRRDPRADLCDDNFRTKAFEEVASKAIGSAYNGKANRGKEKFEHTKNPRMVGYTTSNAVHSNDRLFKNKLRNSKAIRLSQLKKSLQSRSQQYQARWGATISWARMRLRLGVDESEDAKIGRVMALLNVDDPEEARQYFEDAKIWVMMERRESALRHAQACVCFYESLGRGRLSKKIEIEIRRFHDLATSFTTVLPLDYRSRDQYTSKKEAKRHHGGVERFNRREFKVLQAAARSALEAEDIRDRSKYPSLNVEPQGVFVDPLTTRFFTSGDMSTRPTELPDHDREKIPTLARTRKVIVPGKPVFAVQDSVQPTAADIIVPPEQILVPQPVSLADTSLTSLELLPPEESTAAPCTIELKEEGVSIQGASCTYEPPGVPFVTQTPMGIDESAATVALKKPRLTPLTGLARLEQHWYPDAVNSSGMPLIHRILDMFDPPVTLSIAPGGHVNEKALNGVILHSVDEAAKYLVTMFRRQHPHDGKGVATDTHNRLHHLILRWTVPNSYHVEVAGTFTEPPWLRRIKLFWCPINRCHWVDLHEYFSTLSGVHQFKFIVDGCWKCDPHSPICDDGSGEHHLNNVMVVIPKTLKWKLSSERLRKRHSSSIHAMDPGINVSHSVRQIPVQAAETRQDERAASSESSSPSSQDAGDAEEAALLTTPAWAVRSPNRNARADEAAGFALKDRLPPLSSTSAERRWLPARWRRNVDDRFKKVPRSEIETTKREEPEGDSPLSRKPVGKPGTRSEPTSELQGAAGLTSQPQGSSTNPPAIEDHSGEVSMSCELQRLPHAQVDTIKNIEGSSESSDVSEQFFPAPKPHRQESSSHEEKESDRNEESSESQSSLESETGPTETSRRASLASVTRMDTDIGGMEGINPESLPAFSSSRPPMKVPPGTGHSSSVDSQSQMIGLNAICKEVPKPAVVSGGGSSCSRQVRAKLVLAPESRPETPCRGPPQYRKRAQERSRQIIKDRFSFFESLRAGGTAKQTNGSEKAPARAENEPKRSASADGDGKTFEDGAARLSHGELVSVQNKDSKQIELRGTVVSPGKCLWGQTAIAADKPSASEILYDEHLRRVSSMTLHSFWPKTVTENLHDPEVLLELLLPSNVVRKEQFDLTLQIGYAMTPHPNKTRTGGADAFYVSRDGLCMAVADGVGEWERWGYKPQQFADELVESIASIWDDKTHAIHTLRTKEKNLKASVIARELMRFAYTKPFSYGSATCCVAIFDPATQTIGVCNLGDSGFAVLTRGSNFQRVQKLRTQPLCHFFNCPYQFSRTPPMGVLSTIFGYIDDRNEMSLPSEDLPKHADLYDCSVLEGDLIIMATDGFWDNLWDYEIRSLCNLSVSPFEALLLHDETLETSAEEVAKALAEAASFRSRDPSFRTPFAKMYNVKCGMREVVGGKWDDITVVGAWLARKNYQSQSSVQSQRSGDDTHWEVPHDIGEGKYSVYLGNDANKLNPEFERAAANIPPRRPPYSSASCDNSDVDSDDEFSAEMAARRRGEKWSPKMIGGRMLRPEGSKTPNSERRQKRRRKYSEFGYRVEYPI